METDFQGRHTYWILIHFGNIGKDGARGTDKSVARYIHVLTEVF